MHGFNRLETQGFEGKGLKCSREHSMSMTESSRIHGSSLLGQYYNLASDFQVSSPPPTPLLPFFLLFLLPFLFPSFKQQNPLFSNKFFFTWIWKQKLQLSVHYKYFINSML